MTRKLVAPALALLLAAAALPAAGALQQEQIRTDQVPLGLVVTIQADPESRQRPPAVTSTPGWECGLTRWEPVQSDFAFVEAQCQPNVTPPPNAQWVCRNIGVEVQAQGFGSVTGNIECEGLSASCTATAPSPGYCIQVTPGVGIPPVRCWAVVSGFVVSWHVRCINDP